MRFFDSDLATERRRADVSVPGVNFSREELGTFAIEKIEIKSRAGERSVGRPRGHYHTLFTPPTYMMEDEDVFCAKELLREMLAEVAGKMTGGVSSLLFVGLGSLDLTADALGPQTAGKIRATRFLEKNSPVFFRDLGCASLTVMAPGVSSATGYDAAVAIKGVCEAVKPDLVIAADALAARDTERLGRTFQLSDTGITPGSGVGNTREPITAEALGVPVLAVGVPTVVNADVFVREAFRKKGVPLPKRTDNPLFVSPKDIDGMIKTASEIIADAVNRAFGADF